MPWIRSGECCRCGECCVGDPFADEDRPREAVVQGYCPLFELHQGAPEGDGFCIGHEPPNQHPYYLSGCNVWPDHPDNIVNCPSCTYKFTWVD
jgi:hypothetical protein